MMAEIETSQEESTRMIVDAQLVLVEEERQQIEEETDSSDEQIEEETDSSDPHWRNGASRGYGGEG
jgi:hypothetical protein